MDPGVDAMIIGGMLGHVDSSWQSQVQIIHNLEPVWLNEKPHGLHQVQNGPHVRHSGQSAGTLVEQLHDRLDYF